MARRWLIAAGGSLLAAGVCFTPVKRTHSDNLADVEVRIRPPTGAAIQLVSVEAFSSAEAAAPYLEDRVPAEGGLYSAMQNPYVGAPLHVRVPMGEVEDSALLWKRSRRWQFPVLVVVYWLEGAERRAKLVELPDLRTTRSVEIDLP